MPSFTIIKHADIKALPLDPKGQRAGADQGDPQIAVRLWCALLVLKFLCAFIICSKAVSVNECACSYNSYHHKAPSPNAKNFPGMAQ